MTIEETVDLLTVAAAYDRRTVGEGDAIAWHAAIGDLPLDECRAAVIGHYADSTDWLMPGHVRKRVKAMRDARIARSIPAAPPAELADDPGRYRAELKAQIRRIADGRSMDRAIEGPPAKGEPPAEFAEGRAGFGEVLERPGSVSPQEIARRQAAEARAARAEREDPPAKDPAA